MLTGTPLDLTFIPELLEWLGAAIPIAWLLLLLAAIGLVMWKVRSLAGWLLGVAGVFVLLVALPIWKLGELRKQAVVARAEDDAEQAKFRERLAVAEALFKKRCETAGEFIYKTVPDVKGVVWMKWRDGSGESDGSHQYGLYDPYGRDCGDESCMGDLLKATEGRHFASETNVPIGTGEYGYDYVETTDPKDGRHYRYAMRYYRSADRPASGGVKWLQNAARAELHKTEIDRFTARYGITWDDISIREDRENWIAGGVLSVIDLQTNEVIARRMGYMMDPGLGSTEGFRDPWGYARENACPSWVERPGREYHARHRTTDFLFKVLQPTK